MLTKDSVEWQRVKNIAIGFAIDAKLQIMNPEPKEIDTSHIHDIDIWGTRPKFMILMHVGKLRAVERDLKIKPWEDGYERIRLKSFDLWLPRQLYDSFKNNEDTNLNKVIQYYQ